MQENQTEALNSITEKELRVQRRKLIPVWIKIFIWMFLISGDLALIGIVLGLLGIPFKLALYELEANGLMSVLGMSLIAIFLLKGAVAFGLWTGKDWAITFGYVDAFGGIAVCVAIMILPF
ncbi:MAG: hypothetical protein HRT71_16480 [Flavobacteriales bacterium]|nr:hypothetical protein [Flavobacteriales bacterium]